jgi:DNA-binding HxlR family transcriptional regulator
MVRHSVNKLVEKGIIKVDVFNEDKFDHTYWYTFTAYGNELLDDSRCFD